MSQVSGLRYTLYADDVDIETLTTRVADVLAADTVGVERKQKAKKPRKGRGRRGLATPRTAEVDIRPMIDELILRESSANQGVIDFTTVAQHGKLAKPREILAVLGLDPAATRVVKRETLLADSLATA
jgi:hypothetical protein